MNNKKVVLWQYFTKSHFWLKEHIIDFITSQNKDIAFDPFAWWGDLLNVAKKIGFKKIKWFDIDKSLKWEINDSLLNIPNIKNSIIITNPPYLTNYSAKRKWIYDNVKIYFDNCKCNDLYKLAIEKCLENNECWIMIIPETFINSTVIKSRLVSITIIEDLMFKDTENPICVICFDKEIKKSEKIKIFKNEKYLWNLKNFENMRKIPNKNIFMKFNSLKWQIALRAVDTTKIEKKIEFIKPEDINYDLSKIKSTSRLITLIEMHFDENKINNIIKISNNILKDFRIKSNDILLSPFKWNMNNWERRRRLDYKTARAILEEAENKI